MKQSLIIDFILDMNDEAQYYFEIMNSTAEYPQISLCKVVHSGDYNSDVITIKKIGISMNSRYAEWLKYNSGTYHIDKYHRNTILNHLYENKHWFVSLEHTNGVDKYIKELDNYMKELEEE
jgi:hypothetical protein